jgi:hypothetical protein
LHRKWYICTPHICIHMRPPRCILEPCETPYVKMREPIRVRSVSTISLHPTDNPQSHPHPRHSQRRNRLHGCRAPHPRNLAPSARAPTKDRTHRHHDARVVVGYPRYPYQFIHLTICDSVCIVSCLRLHSLVVLFRNLNDATWYTAPIIW